MIYAIKLNTGRVVFKTLDYNRAARRLSRYPKSAGARLLTIPTVR